MTIICATNFSHPATAALAIAETLALKLQGRLLLVHVVAPGALGTDLVSAAERGAVVAMTRATEALTGVVDRLRARGIAADCRVIMGRPAEGILGVAHVEHADLVVLGSDARKGHLLIRSLPEQVAREAPCPVLVTRGLPYPQPGLSSGARLHLMVFVCGRPAADAALGWVKGIRAKVACDVTFVEPYLPEETGRKFGLGDLAPGGAESIALRPLLERDLRAWVGTLPGHGEVHFRFRASTGHNDEDVAAAAEELQPDLVVVGLRGDRHRSEAAGLSEAVALRSIKLPTVCVPERLRPPSDRRIPLIRTVLVGTDLSDFAAQAIPAAYALLLAAGGTLEICHVHERPDPGRPPLAPPGPLPLASGERCALERRLEELVVPAVASARISSQVAVVEAEAAAEGLLAEADRIGADVVVVASRGRTGLRRVLMGSVAAELTRIARRPVLVLHPPAR